MSRDAFPGDGDTQPDADGWIPWAGGEWPPILWDSYVEVKVRDGDKFVGEEADIASNWVWIHDGDPCDIIAYRIARK